MTHLVRRLLWASYDDQGKLTAAFRVTEDRGLADVNGDSVALPEEAKVGLVHPLQLTAQMKGQWSEVFADYELMPPFPQLGRPVYHLQESDVEAETITRHKEVAVPALALQGTLERLGWQRGVPMDGGVFHNFSRYFPGADVTAILGIETGIPIGYMEGWEDQKMTGCIFLSGPQRPMGYLRHFQGMVRGEKSPVISPAQVDPVVISEVLSDMAQAASKGKA
jgi:hypothetical protein